MLIKRDQKEFFDTVSFQLSFFLGLCWGGGRGENKKSKQLTPKCSCVKGNRVPRSKASRHLHSLAHGLWIQRFLTKKKISLSTLYPSNKRCFHWNPFQPQPYPMGRGSLKLEPSFLLLSSTAITEQKRKKTNFLPVVFESILRRS